MDSVICKVCPSCNQERPEKDILNFGPDVYQCRICMMLNKETVKGPLLTRSELNALKAAKKDARTKPQAKPVKKEPTSATCPGCLKSKDIEGFKTSTGVVYRFCNTCRDNEIKLGDERAKRLLGGGLFSNVSMTVGRCINCGHIGNIETDFPVDVTKPTGYKPYCFNKCEGRRR